MAELEAAQRHLTEALRRLESALARRLSAGGPVPMVKNGEVRDLVNERNALADHADSLRQECERLHDALKVAEQEREVARSAADSVARRLDGSIAELDRLLEG